MVSITLGSHIAAESQFGLPDPGLTPESPLYFLDLWDERARFFFARSDAGRLKRYQARVLERLSESEALAGRGIAATQKALELYRADIPRLFAVAERTGDMLILKEVLQSTIDYFDVLDHISERTNFDKKQFIPETKLFLVNQHLQSLQTFAKREPADALRIFGGALGNRMERLREVAIDDENNKEALEEYTAYLSETDRIIREWSKVEVEGLGPVAYLAVAMRGHEETLVGPVRERLSPTLEQELLLAVNGVRKLSGLEPLQKLPMN